MADRIEEAKRLLEGSQLSVEQLATQVGFATGQALRQHFRKRLQLSPREYRNSFKQVPAWVG